MFYFISTSEVPAEHLPSHSFLYFPYCAILLVISLLVLNYIL